MLTKVWKSFWGWNIFISILCKSGAWPSGRGLDLVIFFTSFNLMVGAASQGSKLLVDLPLFGHKACNMALGWSVRNDTWKDQIYINRICSGVTQPDTSVVWRLKCNFSSLEEFADLSQFHFPVYYMGCTWWLGISGLRNRGLGLADYGLWDSSKDN